MKSFFGWLKNSTKIKRWIVLIIIGMVLACYGFAQVLVLEKLLLTDIIKIVAIFVFGVTIFTVGLVFMQRRTLELAAKGEVKGKEEVLTHDKGPKVVVIGGGSGLNTLLKGLKHYTGNITAIVPVTSYGDKIKNAPTKDIIESIIALSENREEMDLLMKQSFKESKLKDITFGDLFLKSIVQTYGDFAKSIEKTSNILSMTGKVLPVTQDEMRVCVELDNGMVVENKDKIADVTSDKVTKINRVYISPSNCKTSEGIIEAIQEADAIIIGPGSLYVNVIPNLLMKNVAKTIRESKAFKIYVSNIMTEPGHTDDYDVSDHINAIIEHAGKDIIDYCICDNGDIVPEFLRKYNKAGSSLVNIDSQKIKGSGVKLIKEDVSYIEGEYIRHNPETIAKVIIEMICNEMKFKDKQNDEQYLLLNSKLKEDKKKEKKNKVKKEKPKTEKNRTEEIKRKSKFSSKYEERIKSIQDSEETRQQNLKLRKQAEAITKAEEKKEKERFLKETYGKMKK